MYKLISTLTISIGILIMMLPGYASAQEIDPTRPLFGASETVNKKANQTIKLQSIVNNGQDLTVVINGKLLKVGDRIEQYQLEKINNNSVVLSSPEKRLQLSLFSPIVAKSQ